MGVPAESRTPGSAHRAQRRAHRNRAMHRGVGARRRRDDRPRRLSRAVPSAPDAVRTVRDARGRPRIAAAAHGAVHPRAAATRRGAQAHQQMPARPVPRPARRPSVPAGAQPGSTIARRRLVGDRKGLGRHPRRPSAGMITRDLEAFAAVAAALPADAPACARAVFMVAPDGFRLAEQSASDNRYMAMGEAVDEAQAVAEHRALQDAVRQVLPVTVFPGDAATPDAVFPNNVFATAPGRYLVGHMRHAVRRREAERADIRAYFKQTLERREIDLSLQPGVCELTGSLVIDRARGIGFCGLSERCDETGARAMHEAFGLNATLLFDLADGEYHTNVVLSVLAARAVAIAASGFADDRVPAAIAALFGGQRAHDSLDDGQRAQLAAWGFGLHAVPLPMLEKAGGSLRCCVGEVY